jgi:cell division protein FtsB
MPCCWCCSAPGAECFLQRLRSDPSMAEKVIRERLGYGKPGEVIFRFDNNP